MFSQMNRKVLTVITLTSQIYLRSDLTEYHFLDDDDDDDYDGVRHRLETSRRPTRNTFESVKII